MDNRLPVPTDAKPMTRRYHGTRAEIRRLERGILPYISDCAAQIGNPRLSVTFSLQAIVATLAAAVDDHTHPLDHIEKRLGIGTPAN